MIIQTKKELNLLTHKLLELTVGYEWDILEIKKQITSVLSKISTMSTIAKSSNYKSDPFLELGNLIFGVLDLYESGKGTNFPLSKWGVDRTRKRIGIFCNYANMIEFNVRKQTIIFPKIDLAIFKL